MYRASSRKRNIKLDVVSIQVVGNRRIGKNSMDRGSVKGEKERTENRALRNASGNGRWSGGSRLNYNRLGSVLEVGSNKVKRRSHDTIVRRKSGQKINGRSD